MEHAIRRSEHRRLPALLQKRSRQLAHDIADAADLAAAQRTVLACEKYDVLLADRITC
jgi:hypothetical protein